MNNLLKENKIGLSNIVRANFEKFKIKKLENPNQELHIENKFIRDKSAITQGMNKLKEDICKI